MTSTPGTPPSPRQLQALTAAATGATLTEIGHQLGITREHASMLLSHAYRRLGVAHLPRAQKRAAAVREATRRGLIPDPARPVLRQHPDELRERAETDDLTIHPPTPAEEPTP